MGTHTVTDAKREVAGHEMRSHVDRDLWSGRDSNPRPPACKALSTFRDSRIATRKFSVVPKETPSRGLRTRIAHTPTG